MHYFVRELVDKRAVLIAEDGYPLSVFANVNEAVATCIVDCLTAPLWIEWHRDASVQSVDSDCISAALAQHFRFRRSPAPIARHYC